MIEEAAGTRMYETKKQLAEKTIEKKDAKLKELNDVSRFISIVQFSIDNLTTKTIFIANQLDCWTLRSLCLFVTLSQTSY